MEELEEFAARGERGDYSVADFAFEGREPLGYSGLRAEHFFEAHGDEVAHPLQIAA